MRRAVFVLVLLTGAAPLMAAEAQKTDYSRATILRILHDRDREQTQLKVDIGMLQIQTRNARFRLAWLPFLAPLLVSADNATGAQSARSDRNRHPLRFAKARVTPATGRRVAGAPRFSVSEKCT